MIVNRGPEHGSKRCGRSTHNQRIKRLWRNVYNGVTGLYHELFSFMEYEEILNVFNLTALHYIFLPAINDKSDLWRRVWSKHRM